MARTSVKAYGEDIVVGSSLGGFFDTCKRVLLEDETYWFRGHADISWELTPSALRYKTVKKRDKAIGLLDDFKRYGEIKLPNAPPPDEQLRWVQLAQHYGLPTRLLDWTKNASIALYFACQNSPDNPEADGRVIVLNPIDLNRSANPNRPRILNPHNDISLIQRYLNLTGRVRVNGSLNVAINPVWNSERIMLQQGVFTLHGSREFAIKLSQTPLLLCLRIKKCSLKTWNVLA